MTGPAHIWLALLLSPAQAPPDAFPLSLADLPAYRSALADPADAPARVATFRDLWDRPDSFRSRRVAVEGRLARRFRQDATGQFPALVESWLATPSGDLVCAVHPDSDASEALRVGSIVRFSGRFLRRIRYGGADVDRLAPLLVGPAAPELVEPPAPGKSPLANRFGPADWAVGLAAGGLVLVALLTRVLRKPPSRPATDRLPPPDFLDPGPYNPDADPDPNASRNQGPP
jgi:hypothetical protein